MLCPLHPVGPCLLIFICIIRLLLRGRGGDSRPSRPGLLGSNSTSRIRTLNMDSPPCVLPSRLSGWEETAGGEALLDCGIQCKWKGVVLSPLLVITIIIMEISQQAPEASPFISSPTPAWCQGPGMRGPSGCQRLLFAEVAWTGMGGSRGAWEPPVEGSRAGTSPGGHSISISRL